MTFNLDVIFSWYGYFYFSSLWTHHIRIFYQNRTTIDCQPFACFFPAARWKRYTWTRKWHSGRRKRFGALPWLTHHKNGSVCQHTRIGRSHFFNCFIWLCGSKLNSRINTATKHITFCQHFHFLHPQFLLYYIDVIRQTYVWTK